MIGTRWVNHPERKQPHQRPWVVALVVVALVVALYFSFA